MSHPSAGARRPARFLVAAVSSVAVLAACSSTGSADGSGGESASVSGQTITYWLWDTNQQPAYQQCADGFKASSGVTVKIEQYGWDDYWNGLSTGFASGTAPDVFADHLAYFPQFVSQGQLVPVSELIERDQVDLSIYQPDLTKLWVGQDGQQYGLPKDFDTVGIFYNEDMVTKAGYSAEDLAALQWNPADGGTFEQLLAKLTVDDKGVHGDEPGFDKDHVAVYATSFQGGSIDASGQISWSPFALSNGWSYGDKTPWTTAFNYGDPKLTETLTWFRRMQEKGYFPPLAQIMSDGDPLAGYLAGKYATVVEGDWVNTAYLGQTDVPTSVMPTPVGPSGKRGSLYNGLTDGIWSGTEHKEAAWQWVKYLGSTACQDVVAEKAVVFPAIKTSTDIALKAFQEKDWNVAPFIDQVEDGNTTLLPIADHWSDVQDLFSASLQQFLQGDADPSIFPATNDKINALFE